MRPSCPTVFLVDVDNTLLDNDAIQQDLKDHIEGVFGRAARDRYWRILDDLFTELGYRDYIELSSATVSNIRARLSCCPCHRSSSIIRSPNACIPG